MRIFSLILFLSVALKPAFAQQGSQEKKTLNSAGATYAKIDQLNKSAHEIFLNSPDSAHKLAATALLLSEQAKYPFGKGCSFLDLGCIYWSQSYYAISLFYLRSAIINLPKNKPLYQADAYRALGRTYAELKNYKAAEASLDTSLQLSRNDTASIAEVYSERAFIDNQLGLFEQAIANVKLSAKFNSVVHAKGNIAVLYSRLASIYLSKKAWKNARVFNDIAYDMSKTLPNKRLLACTYVNYALIDNATGKYNDAVNYAMKGISLAGSLGVMDAETRAFDAMENAYELQHEYIKALAWQKRYNIVRDSLSDLAKVKTVTLVQNYYDLNAKMNGIALMRANDRINQAKIKSQHTMIRLLLFSLAIVMIVLTATYYFYKQKKLLSNKLQQQHTELSDQKQVIDTQRANLQKANDLKDKLFAVIGHDLRSPVANLSNIIEMFDEGYLTADEVHDLMRNINPVIKGIELTLSNLVEWAGSQIKGINVHPTNVDIFLMGMEMEQTFLHALKVKRIEFSNKAYPGRGALADENHLKVILRNLISNAIKFTQVNGMITLATTIENNELIISVKDSGKGMTEEEISCLFYINTHFSQAGTQGEKGTGLGLLLCKELIELNGGKLKVKSKPGKGSSFYFNLPLVNAYA